MIDANKIQLFLFYEPQLSFREQMYLFAEELLKNQV